MLGDKAPMNHRIFTIIILHLPKQTNYNPTKQLPPPY